MWRVRDETRPARVSVFTYKYGNPYIHIPARKSLRHKPSLCPSVVQKKEKGILFTYTWIQVMWTGPQKRKITCHIADTIVRSRIYFGWIHSFFRFLFCNIVLYKLHNSCSHQKWHSSHLKSTNWRKILQNLLSRTKHFTSNHFSKNKVWRKCFSWNSRSAHF